MIQTNAYIVYVWSNMQTAILYRYIISICTHLQVFCLCNSIVCILCTSLLLCFFLVSSSVVADDLHLACTEVFAFLCPLYQPPNQIPSICDNQAV